MARDMIEKFGNPVPIDEPVRKSFNRGRPATVPSTHTPIVWDTPYDTDASGMDGTANRFFSKGNERLYEAYSQLHNCLLYTSPSPRDRTRSRMPSSA